MLIPGIDLSGQGRAAWSRARQSARSGKRRAERWSAFLRLPELQVIDLDAAMGSGTNGPRHGADDLPPASVPGRRRHPHRGASAGAQGRGRPEGNRRVGPVQGRPSGPRARERLSPWRSDGRTSSAPWTASPASVVIHGWKTAMTAPAVEAVRALEPYCGEFLYTHVDKEGLMRGTDMAAIVAMAQALDCRRRHHHQGGDRRARSPGHRRRRRHGHLYRHTGTEIWKLRSGS